MAPRRLARQSLPTAVDVGRALVVAALCLAVTLLVNQTLAETPRPVDLAWVGLTVLACMSVAFLRSMPFVASVMTLALSLLGVTLDFPMTGPIVLGLVLVGVTASRADVRLTRTLGVISGATIATIAATGSDEALPIGAVGGFAVVGMLPALIGARLRAERVRVRDARELARRVEEGRDSDVERAVAEERLRIARDIHDITGHHLSGISLLAAGASRTTRDPTASDALRRIHELTREALGQTSRALGVVREDSDPTELAPLPRLAHVERLLEPARTSGADVRFTVEGSARELSETVELCAYRVIQESLTNVVRHARAASVKVVVGYSPEALTVTVDDDGVGARVGTARTGSGIVGMRERISLLGGQLTTGPDEGGGWSVRATIPLEVAR